MLQTLTTPRGETLSGTPWQVYPRPQMRRDSYINLNGEWDFAASSGKPETFDMRITVPFCPESRLSGIGRWTGSAGSTNKQAGHEPRPGSRTPERTGTAARRRHPGGNPARGVPSVGFSGPCIAVCRLFPIVPCERTPVPRESRCGLRLIF